MDGDKIYPQEGDMPKLQKGDDAYKSNNQENQADNQQKNDQNQKDDQNKDQKNKQNNDSDPENNNSHNSNDSNQGNSGDNSRDSSKTKLQTPGNAIKDKAKQLGKNALTGKNNKQNNTLKDQAKNKLAKGAGKVVKVEAPKMAALYAGGKLFDTMMKFMGMMLGQAGSMVQAAIANSPMAGLINLAHNVIQGAANLMHAIGHGIGMAGHAIASGIGHAGSFFGAIGHAATVGTNAIAHAVGVSTVQAATSLGTIAAVTTVGIVGGGVMLYQNNGIRDDGNQAKQCQALVDSAFAGGGKEGGDQNAQMTKIAKHIYSALKVFGCDDDQIAGLLGNWQVESICLDPTAVEGIYGESYHIGPKKKAALGDLSGYTSKVSTGNAQYTSGGACPGIGFGQWTGGNGLKVMAAAKKAHTKWYDEGFQLAYAIANVPTGGSGDSFWSAYKKLHGVSTTTHYFLTKWEGISDGSYSNRLSNAQSWRKQMSSWNVDSSYGKSIINMAKHMGTASTAKAVESAAQSCAQAQGNSDNSDMANAALSYAWDSEDLAKGNNGTKLYQAVHKAVLPGDGYFMSCDRQVASAAKWSGTDISYPAGPCPTQQSYLSSSKKWKKVGTTASYPYKSLKPGDVMVDHDHTYIYVGNDAVKASIKKGQHKASQVPSQADDVDASYGERSAGIGIEARWSIIDHKDGPYDIYRCVKPDHSKKYASAGKNVR